MGDLIITDCSEKTPLDEALGKIVYALYAARASSVVLSPTPSGFVVAASKADKLCQVQVPFQELANHMIEKARVAFSGSGTGFGYMSVSVDRQRVICEFELTRPSDEATVAGIKIGLYTAMDAQ